LSSKQVSSKRNKAVDKITDMKTAALIILVGLLAILGKNVEITVLMSKPFNSFG